MAGRLRKNKKKTVSVGLDEISTNQFAWLMREAINFREESWMGEYYTRSFRDSALKACEVSTISDEWATVVELLMITAWNDIIIWCDNMLIGEDIIGENNK